MKEETLVLDHPMSVEEYIEFEERSEVRHEMINQQLFEMPGATTFHNLICHNIYFIIRQLLKGKACKIFVEGVKVQVSENRDYLYPDLMVTCDERDAHSKYIIKFPSVIFEVISKNSRVYDTVDKFILYKNIESLKNYVLVDSEKCFVEVRERLENGDWEATTYFLEDAEFPVPALELELSFSAIYEETGLLKEA